MCGRVSGETISPSSSGPSLSCPLLPVRRGDVLAAWSGLRPLVMDPNKKDTQSIARNHVIEVSDSNLVTIAGGEGRGSGKEGEGRRGFGERRVRGEEERRKRGRRDRKMGVAPSYCNKLLL